MAALIIRDGPSAGQRVEISAELVLGRAENEFLQHDNEVSRRHASVRSAPEGLTVEDLGSSNGTFVNDRQIEGATVLSSGDVLRIGQTTFDVEVEPAQRATVIRETATPPVAPVETTAPQAAQPPEPPTPPPVPSAYGPPPAPAYPPPPGGFAARPGGVVAAGIILILVGLGSMGYNGWDLTLLIGDLELLRQIGFGWLGTTLLVIDIVLIVSGLLQLIGGIQVMSGRPAGRTLGLIGCVGIVAGWAVFLGVALSQGLSLNALAWAALVLSVAGSILAGAMLLTAGRSLTRA
ncbi:MAG: FHA domain-containing protein [Actinomycetota bacterium]